MGSESPMIRYCSSVALIGVFLTTACRAGDAADIRFHGDNSACEVRVQHNGDRLTVSWPLKESRSCTAVLSLPESTPLIRSLTVTSTVKTATVLENASPEFQLFVGKRKANSKGPYTFFDRVDERKYRTVVLDREISAATVTSGKNRASVRLDNLTGDGFTGSLELTFFAGSPLIQIEAVISTDQPDRAFVFRGGLTSPNDQIRSVVFHRAGDSLESLSSSDLIAYRPSRLLTIGRRQGFGERGFDRNTTPLIGSEDDGILQARYRAVAVDTAAGAVAVFPAPHKFLYPLDFADNVGFNFAWTRDQKIEVGIRQPPLGDGRFRPWVDCPPGSQQRLDLFLLVSTESGRTVLGEVAKFTHDERYPQPAGFKTFTSHYHMWHTRELIQAQQRLGTEGIPPEFERPFFVEKMKDTGIDIVHLAEFHGGPRTGKSRIEELQVLHSECARLSDGEILVLPGEEPNVHLGGHWVSFFPRPVYWDFVNGTTSDEVRRQIRNGNLPPFQREDAALGSVYFVNSAADVQKLFEQEGGLYWTAHPRIKGSTGYPDRYRFENHYKSPAFFGAAWKAMPADYSHDRLGRRVLDLLDDMNEWGQPKQILGEADVFKLNPASELYGHANINYLLLKSVPRFEDGWSEVLDALRDRKYFTSTGEVLITSFRVNGQEFPAQISPGKSEEVWIEARVRGTFPLAFAEVICSDGSKIRRKRVDLSSTGEFATTKISHRLPEDCKWVRLEVWDVAENGAFTQPVMVTFP